MNDPDAERDRIERAIRHLEAKLMKSAHGPIGPKDLASLALLHDMRRRLLARSNAKS